nr:MetQ/NlpA family ABC transporter substrate-binding protein [uncultured Cellulosilyticum sp.]
MKNLKRLIVSILFISILGVFTGCGSNTSADTKIKVGVNGTDFTIWNYIKDELAKEDIELEVVSFSDYIQPNIALAEGEIDINSFQTEIYFNQFIKDRNLDLVSIGYSVIAPMAVFSETVTDIGDTPQNAKVAIPTDATNGGRALIILEQAGLIKLKEGVGATPTVNDIIENPKNLEITSVDPNIIPRSLQDIDLGVINSNVAVTAGLKPLEDSIYIQDINNEDAKNYYNIFAVRNGDEERPELKRLVEIYRTEPVKELINKVYGGAQIPLF